MSIGLQMTSLPEICLLVTDGTHDSPKLQPSGIPFIKGKHISSGTIDFENCDYITEADHQECIKRIKPQVGDVLFANIGSVGDIAPIKEDIEFSIKNVALFRPNPERVGPQYFYYLIKSPFFKDSILNITSGAAQQFITLEKFRSHKFQFIADIDIQNKIASILSAYDELIENNLKRIKLLEEAAQLLYRHWFVNFKFPGHEKTKFINGIPEGWETKTMEDVCQSVGGGTPSTKVPQYWDNGTITWIIPTDITQNDSLILLDSEKKITPEGLQHSSAKMLPPDTILMTSRASVGFFGLIDKEVCTNQGFISVIPNDDYMRMYLLFNLICRKDEIVSKAGGATYKEINKSTFRGLEILVPDGEILNQFNPLAYEYLRQARISKKQNNCLKEARDILLPRLMDGSIEI